MSAMCCPCDVVQNGTANMSVQCVVHVMWFRMRLQTCLWCVAHVMCRMRLPVRCVVHATPCAMCCPWDSLCDVLSMRPPVRCVVQCDPLCDVLSMRPPVWCVVHETPCAMCWEGGFAGRVVVYTRLLCHWPPVWIACSDLWPHYNMIGKYRTLPPTLCWTSGLTLIEVKVFWTWTFTFGYMVQAKTSHCVVIIFLFVVVSVEPWQMYIASTHRDSVLMHLPFCHGDKVCCCCLLLLLLLF